MGYLRWQQFLQLLFTDHEPLTFGNYFGNVTDGPWIITLASAVVQLDYAGGASGSKDLRFSLRKAPHFAIQDFRPPAVRGTGHRRHPPATGGVGRRFAGPAPGDTGHDK